jgi:hypothetical protein
MSGLAYFWRHGLQYSVYNWKNTASDYFMEINLIYGIQEERIKSNIFIKLIVLSTCNKQSILYCEYIGQKDSNV